jgi:raffinose/stachyose/melibiose transport system substrate-binding protein
MMKRKWLFTLSMLAIVAMAITQCAPGPAATEAPEEKSEAKTEQVTLHVVLSSYWEEEWWTKIIDKFEEENPNIKIDYWWGADWTEYTQTKIAAGDAPDFFWLTRYEWIDNGLVMDLTEALQTPPYGETSGTWLDTFYAQPGPIEYKGRLWTLPWDLYSDGYVWYNVGIFEEHGKEPPETWDDLMELCEYFKSQDIACFAQSNDLLYANQWFRFLAQRIAGLEKIRATGAADRQEGNHWTDPEFLQAAEMAQSVAENGYFVSGYEGLDYHSAQVEFVQGHAAMMLIGNWLAGEMADSIPEDLRLDYVRFPEVAGGKGDPTVQIAGTSDVILSAKTKHPEELILFAKYLTSLEATKSMAEDSHLLYGTKGSTPKEEMTTFDRKAIQYMEEAADTFEWYAPPDFAPTFEMGDQMFNDSVSLMLLQITPEGFLQRLEDRMVELEKGQ